MAAVAASLLLLQCVASMVAGAASQYSSQSFVDLQNAARADVGVAPLAWDDTLAAYARRYAGERKGDCALVHSKGPYGENIFWGSAGSNWTAGDVVALWVQEKQYYNCTDGSCAAGNVCSHYAQVVWANTTRVGCAAVSCDGNGGTFILSQSSPQDFLNLQNAARAGVGVGMLSWDTTVAAYAESYAERRKGDCLKVPSGGPYGENIFQGSAGVSWTISDAFFSWLGEKRSYDCASNTCKEGSPCGEYTQLVWANSTRLGCATVTCEAGGTFIACNYDPPGNLAGERPYLGCGQAGTTPTSDKGNGTKGKENSNSSDGNSSNPARNGSSPAILPIVLPVVTTLGLITAISICLLWRKRSTRHRTTLSACKSISSGSSICPSITIWMTVDRKNLSSGSSKWRSKFRRPPKPATHRPYMDDGATAVQSNFLPGSSLPRPSGAIGDVGRGGTRERSPSLCSPAPCTLLFHVDLARGREKVDKNKRVLDHGA